jgi:hypothetical protein
VSDGLDIVLTLPDSTLECRGVVVRRNTLDDGRQDVSVLFLGLKESTQDVIRRVVFAVLRDNRSRGLL